MAFTIEFDVSPAEAELDKIERKLQGTSRSATAAGKKTGDSYAIGLKKAIKEAGIGDTLKASYSKQQVALGVDKTTGDLASKHQQVVTLQNKQLQQLQSIIQLESERNKLMLAASGLNKNSRVAAETETLKQQSKLYKSITSARVESSRLSSADHQKNLKALEVQTEINSVIKRRVSAQAKLTAANKREVQQEERLLKLAKAQLKARQDRASVSFSRSSEGRELAKQAELTKLILKLEKERAMLKAASSTQGIKAENDLATVQLKNKLLKEEQQLLRLSSASYQKLQKKIKDTTAERKAAERGVVRHTARMKTNVRALNQSNVELVKSNKAWKNFSTVFPKVEASQNKVTRSITRNTKALRANSVATAAHKKHIDLAAQSTSAWRAGLAGLGSHMGIYTSSTILAASAVYGLSRAIKGSIALGTEFSGSMQRAFSVMGTFGSQSATLENFVRELGKTTVFTASEVSEGLVFLGMAGQTMEESIESLHPTLKLASIGLLDMGRAADIVTNIMGGFHIPASGIKDVVDDMSTAVVSANMNIEQLGNSMSYVAPIAYSTGTSIQTVIASLEVLHNAGIKGSRAGTTLRRALVNLYGPSTKASAALSDLGVTAIDVDGKTRPLIKILTELKDAGITLSQVKDIFGVRAASGVLQLIEATKGGEKSLQNLRDALIDNVGAADQLQDKIEDFLGADFKKFTAALEDVGLLAFDDVEGDLRRLTQAATEFFKTISKDDVGEFLGTLGRMVKLLGTLIALFAGGKMTAALAGFGALMLKNVKSTAAFVGIAKTSRPLIVGFGNNIKDASKSVNLMGVQTGNSAKNMSKLSSSSKLASVGVRGLGVAMGFAGKAALGLAGGVLGLIVFEAIGKFISIVVEKLGLFKNEMSEVDKVIRNAAGASQFKESEKAFEGLRSSAALLTSEVVKLNAEIKATKAIADGTSVNSDENVKLRELISERIALRQKEKVLLEDTKKAEVTKVLAANDSIRSQLEAVKQSRVEAENYLSQVAKASSDADKWLDVFDVLSKPAKEANLSRRDKEIKTLRKAQPIIEDYTSRVNTLREAESKLTNKLTENISKTKELTSARAVDTGDTGKIAGQSIKERIGELRNQRVELEATSGSFGTYVKAKREFDAQSKLALSFGVGEDNLAVKAAEAAEKAFKIMSSSKSSYDSEVKRRRDEITKTAETYTKLVAKVKTLRDVEYDAATNSKRIFEDVANSRAAVYKESDRLANLGRAASADEVRNLKLQVKALEKLIKLEKLATAAVKLRATKQLEYIKGMQEIEESFNTEYTQLNKIKLVRDKLKTLQDAQVNGIKLSHMTQKEYNDALRKQLRLMEEIKAKSVNSTYEQQALTGAKHGLEDYRDEITNVYDEVQGLAKDSLQGLEDVFVEFAKTGKFEFTDLIDHIETELLRLGTRKFLMEPLTEMFNSAFSSNGQGSTGFDIGGMLGGMFGGGSSMFSSTPGIDLGSFGGSNPIQGSGGGIFDSIAGLLGFKDGGEFEVGGSGGTDSQLVAFKASPNETVSVRTPNQQDDSRKVEVNNYITIEAPNGNISRQSMAQLQAAMGTGIQRGMRRNT